MHCILAIHAVTKLMTTITLCSQRRLSRRQLLLQLPYICHFRSRLHLP